MGFLVLVDGRGIVQDGFAMNRRSFLKRTLCSTVAVVLGFPEASAAESKNECAGTIDAWLDLGPNKNNIFACCKLSDEQAIIGKVVSTNILDTTHVINTKTPIWINIRTRDSFSEAKKLVVKMWCGHSPEMDKNTRVVFISVGECFKPNTWILRMPLPLLEPKDRFMGLWYELKD